MSVIPACEEYVFAFGSKVMIYITCVECGTLDFDARFDLHFNGSQCCESKPDNPDDQVKTRQTVITTDPRAWFSEDEMKAWRASRKSRGWSKIGRNRE